MAFFQGLGRKNFLPLSPCLIGKTYSPSCLLNTQTIQYRNEKPHSFGVSSIKLCIFSVSSDVRATKLFQLFRPAKIKFCKRKSIHSRTVVPLTSQNRCPQLAPSATKRLFPNPPPPPLPLPPPRCHRLLLLLLLSLGHHLLPPVPRRRPPPPSPPLASRPPRRRPRTRPPASPCFLPLFVRADSSRAPPPPVPAPRVSAAPPEKGASDPPPPLSVRSLAISLCLSLPPSSHRLRPFPTAVLGGGARGRPRLRRRRRRGHSFLAPIIPAAEEKERRAPVFPPPAPDSNFPTNVSQYSSSGHSASKINSRLSEARARTDGWRKRRWEVVN